MADTGNKEDQDVIAPQQVIEPIISSEELAILRKTNVILESRNFELREANRQMHFQCQKAESERDLYKREVNKYKAELDRYRNPPLILGTIESIVDDERVIVKSTTGPQFVSRFSDNVDIDKIKEGALCALHPQSFAVVDILPDKYDSAVTSMEMIEAPDVSYSDIGGLEKQKTLLREAVELPLLHPELFEKVGIAPPKGVLLSGPPGTGKTMLAKAVANETNAAFIRVVGSELVQKYIGEGARLVRELFALAREKSPAIIFIDEIDSVGSSRAADTYSAGDHEVNRTMMQLLAELDGFNNRGNVKIIAATNRIDILDKALLRPGRFDRIIEFSIPNIEERVSILKVHTKKMHLSKSVSLQTIAAGTEGMSGSELMAVCIEAGMNAVREARTGVSQNDFNSAVEAVNKGRNSPETEPDAMYI
ncbi:MAG TPA: proteasome-activating nucleotidase [Methanocorpusculum sp.]|nr:proteasome-activating nucleotidase [Methanocorpusculum sp.]